MPDAPGEGVVGAGEEALSLELEVGVQVLRVVARCAGVAELDDHLAEEDPARVHIGHRDHVFCENALVSAAAEWGESAMRTAVLRTPHERYAILALHRRRDGVAEELRLGPELADDGDLIRRRNVEESGYGWVV